MLWCVKLLLSLSQGSLWLGVLLRSSAMKFVSLLAAFLVIGFTAPGVFVSKIVPCELDENHPDQCRVESGD